MSEQLTQAQRDAYIDESRRVALETLQIPEVQHRLSGYAQVLFTLSESVVSAPVKNEVVITHGVGTDKTPAIAVGSSESLRRMVPGDFFDDHQRQTIQAQHSDQHLSHVTQLFKHAYRDSPFEHLDFPVSSPAAVHTVNPLDGQGKMVKGRPLVVFNSDKSLQPYIAPPIWNHELTHVGQARNLVIWDKSLINFNERHLSEELEAYAVGAMTILGIQDADRQSQLLASLSNESIDRLLEVEDIRAHANKYESDPFAATVKVANELVATNHGITPFLRERIKNR